MACRVLEAASGLLASEAAGRGSRIAAGSTMLNVGTLGLTSSIGAAAIVHGMANCATLMAAFLGGECALANAKYEVVAGSYATW